MMIRKNSQVIEIIQPQVQEIAQGEVELQKVLAMLRALYFLYQDSHWLAAGDHATHLLFERLYKSIIDEMDATAEKLVGTCGFAALNPHMLMEMTREYHSKWSSGVSDSYCKGTSAENEFVSVVGDILKTYLSEGVKNLLAGFVDTHEGNIYLLKK